MRENQIQQFQNQHFGKLTVIEIDSEFFFIGKEVAELLGYKNGSRDVNRHVDEEDRCIFQNYQNGTFENIPNRGVTIINESGLYSLILLSKVLSGQSSAEELCEKMGNVIQKDIRKKIRDIKTPPNAPSTIARKGSSNPLIDTGLLHQSVTYKVRG